MTNLQWFRKQSTSIPKGVALGAEALPLRLKAIFIQVYHTEGAR